MRTVPEWIGKNDDAMPPPNVTLRIFSRAKGCCQSCNRKLMAGEKWIRDHIVPLADGGENRERNIQILCAPCSTLKTSAEASDRAQVRAKARTHAGIKREYRKRPLQSQGFVKKPKREVEQLPLPSRRTVWRVGELMKPMGGQTDD